MNIQVIASEAQNQKTTEQTKTEVPKKIEVPKVFTDAINDLIWFCFFGFLIASATPFVIKGLKALIEMLVDKIIEWIKERKN